MQSIVLATPLGHYEFGFQHETISSAKPTTKPITANLPTLGQQLRQCLSSYFKQPTSHTLLYALPQAEPKTDFQARFRRALQAIPLGQTITYGELATQLNSSPRAIGQACRHNPLPLLIPCHRVVGRHELGGYCGSDPGNIDKKRWLLAHEQS